MKDEALALVAAILTAGVLMRMPGTGALFGDPDRDRAARATEAVQYYCEVLKGLCLATEAGATGL